MMLVDPAGWDPFGEPVDIHVAGPPFLQEMGVVVSAEQRQILKISEAAQDPIQDVVPVAPRRRMRAAREAAAAIPCDQRHGLAWRGEPA